MTPDSPPAHALQALLVDMDGTLLDSEKVWDVALDDLAGWLGGRLSHGARVSMIGSNLALSIGIVHDDLRVDADADASSAYRSGVEAGRT